MGLRSPEGRGPPGDRVRSPVLLKTGERQRLFLACSGPMMSRTRERTDAPTLQYQRRGILRVVSAAQNPMRAAVDGVGAAPDDELMVSGCVNVSSSESRQLLSRVAASKSHERTGSRAGQTRGNAVTGASSSLTLDCTAISRMSNSGQQSPRWTDRLPAVRRSPGRQHIPAFSPPSLTSTPIPPGLMVPRDA